MSDYINTPFGKMPSDWKVLKSSKVIKYLGGNAFKSQDGTEDGVRWLKIANVGIEKPRWTEISYLPDEYLNEFDKYRLEEGDIVMALTRPILSDRLKVCKLGPEDVPALLNQRVAKLETVSQGALLNYYYHFVQTPYFVNRMNVEMAGTDPPNISVSSLNSIEVPVPPLPEQKKIAKILSTVDGHIDEVAGMIEDLKELKKGLMQKLLTEGIGHTEFKDSEVGRIPVEWEVKELGHITSLMTNGFVGTASPYYTDKKNGTKYLQSNNVRMNRIDTSKMVYVNDEFVKNYPNTKVFEGDMLTVQSGHIGTSCIVPPSYDNCNCHALIITRFKSGIVYPNFISHYLNSYSGQNRLSTIFVGSTIKHINVKDLKKIAVPLPSIGEQEKIALIINEVDARIDRQNELRDEYSLLKKGLMQQLLTGKTRVEIDN